MTDAWEGPLADWWLREARTNGAYDTEVLPLLLEVLDPSREALYLDLGCGDGRVMPAVAAKGAIVVGCDLSRDLSRRAAERGPTVVCRLPDLSWVRPGALDGAYAVLVIEHLAEVVPLFEAAARAVRRGGALAVVVNHPVQTAPGSGPFVDPDDSEVLWRWGPYLAPGSSREPAGEGRAVFFHRPLGDLLTAAAGAGWALERALERGVGEERRAADPLLAAQAHIPRLLGLRWQSMAWDEPNAIPEFPAEAA